MKEERPNPYIWVTWLTKIMTGENQCRWASWFRSHYKADKVPSDFDLAAWTAEHNLLLQRRKEELKSKGFTVYIEDQNSFKLRGKTGIEVSGKADIVAIKGDEAYVEDCKTGNPRNSDHMQVLIYILSLPLAASHCKGKTLEGRLIYRDDIVDIPSAKIDESLKVLFGETVRIIGGAEPPEKVPSWGECRFCDITKADCPERVVGEPATEDHDLF
jgi:hypothetical protein